MNKIEKLQELINKSHHIVVMTGAGFSKASGIPDFRSEDGLYKIKNNMISPEEILSYHYFVNQPENFFQYYFEKMIYPDALPNIGHKKLMELEKTGKDITIVTQNIDGLHLNIGSKNVLELHGSVNRNYCMECHKFYTLDEIIHLKDVPHCTCGGIIKPDVVLYEEGLDEKTLMIAINKISNADLLLICGSSMTVNPAASLPFYFNGENLVIINLSGTPIDKYANLIIREKTEEVFEKIKGESNEQNSKI